MKFSASKHFNRYQTTIYLYTRRFTKYNVYLPLIPSILHLFKLGFLEYLSIPEDYIFQYIDFSISTYYQRSVKIDINIFLIKNNPLLLQIDKQTSFKAFAYLSHHNNFPHRCPQYVVIEFGLSLH